MKEKKIFLVALAVIMLVILGANTVFATGTQQIVINPTSTNNNVADNNTVNTAVNNTTNTTNTATNNTVNLVSVPSTTNTSKNNTSVYNNTNTTNLPKTGANDYIIVAVIAVLGVSAIFAYKKVREYNV